MRKNDFLQVDEAKFTRSRNVWIEVGKNWKERIGLISSEGKKIKGDQECVNGRTN